MRAKFSFHPKLGLLCTILIFAGFSASLKQGYGLYPGGNKGNKEYSDEAPCQQISVKPITEPLISLAQDIGDSIIYAASEDSIFALEQNNQSWRKIFTMPIANKRINRLYCSPQLPGIILALTQDGLYQSSNKGNEWKRIFRGSSDLQNDCLSIAATKKMLFLGTKEGLLSSHDNGQTWVTVSDQFSESVISAIVAAPQQEFTVYAASERGVFITTDSGKSWKRIYVLYGSEVPDEDFSDSDSDLSYKVVAISDMVIPSKHPDSIYMVNSKGLFFSDNRGNRWERFSDFGLPPGQRFRSLVASEDARMIFVATNIGVYEFENGRWRKIQTRLINEDIRDMILVETDKTLWVAGKSGIEEYIIKEEITTFQDGNLDETFTISLDELLGDEPTVEEAQRAAIEYAEVNMNKIAAWRRQARLKALFPTISVGYDKNVYGSSSGAMAVGPRGWDLGISWDVADLVWSTDQTSIDSRSRLTVQLRQDILDQVTHLYFERQKLKAELIAVTQANPRERFYKQLELQEVTANLDGLTNGLFSEGSSNL